MSTSLLLQELSTRIDEDLSQQHTVEYPPDHVPDEHQLVLRELHSGEDTNGVSDKSQRGTNGAPGGDLLMKCKQNLWNEGIVGDHDGGQLCGIKDFGRPFDLRVEN